MNDVSFWRIFLRFKHYLRILKSVSNYEEKSTCTTEKVIRSMLDNLVKVQVSSSEEIENQCKTLTDPFQSIIFFELIFLKFEFSNVLIGTYCKK